MKIFADIHKYVYSCVLVFVLMFSIVVSIPTYSHAQDVTEKFADPTKSSFKIVVCDGPAGANPDKSDTTYIPCDFRGIMLQIQHLINIMMVIGVFAAIGAFSWAGALYISGNPEKKKQAHAIFPKVFTGFIIMLSAWFIVYQLLTWLTKNPAFKALIQ